MRALPLIIVVGGDDLAVRVCEELCGTRGHDVVLLWEPHDRLREQVERVGAGFVGLHPNDYDALKAAGVEDASSIMPVCSDDRLNLQVALKARELNSNLRIVLRQFNQTLGRKIEQNLPNCTAISPAAHAAATYAAAAVDPTCFYALQFPDVEGGLLGFSERLAKQFEMDDLTVEEAERRFSFRVLSVNGRTEFDPHEPRHRRDRIVVCAPLEVLQRHRQKKRAHLWKRRLRTAVSELVRSLSRAEPLLVRILFAGMLLYVGAAAFFAWRLHLNPVVAMYFVTATMTTVGYGDITPLRGGQPALLMAMATMLAGMAISGVFIATISATLTRAQERMLHGLRQIHAQDHIVVCGAGNVGMRVVEYLLRLNQRVVVIEQHPNSLLMEFARNRQLDLLTGDATSDETIRFCDLRNARSFLATTDSDTANLEAVLGARVENPQLPVIMRITDRQFARSIDRNFEITVSFSTMELTAPTVAGLSRFPGTRGRVSFDDETYSIAERPQRDYVRVPPVRGSLPLFVEREGNLVPVRDFGEVRPFDRLLYLVPLSQFRGAR